MKIKLLCFALISLVLGCQPKKHDAIMTDASGGDIVLGRLMSTDDIDYLCLNGVEYYYIWIGHGRAMAPSISYLPNQSSAVHIKCPDGIKHGQLYKR